MDAEGDTERRAFKLCFARTRFDVLWSERDLGVFGVVTDDGRAEHHFATRLPDEVAHLERYPSSELINARVHRGGRLCRYGRQLGKDLVPPSLEAGVDGCERRLKLLTRQVHRKSSKACHRGVHALIGHGVVLFQCRWGRPQWWLPRSS